MEINNFYAVLIHIIVHSTNNAGLGYLCKTSPSIILKSKLMVSKNIYKYKTETENTNKKKYIWLLEDISYLEIYAKNKILVTRQREICTWARKNVQV